MQINYHPLRKITGQLHLWLGMVSGLVIIILGITGCIYSFIDEIRPVVYHDRIFITPPPASSKMLPLQELKAIAQKALNKQVPLMDIEVYTDRKHTMVFRYRNRNNNANLYTNYFLNYDKVYLNPYTGEIVKVENAKWEFFNIIVMIHCTLLLGNLGKQIIIWCTVIFLIMLISGLILWWPRNQAAARKRFTFNWKKHTSWKRKNYDLHNVLGFYASIFALIFSLTGLFYAFFVVQAAFYFIFSGGSTAYPDFTSIKTKAPIELRTEGTLDKISNTVKAKYPESFGFAIDLGHPHMDDHEHPNFEVYVKHLSYSYHKSSSLIFDENSGELLHTHDMKDKNFGEKTVGANYDIHVGSILGLPTKIIAFIVSLICASLPVTGFLVWWGRRKKAKKAI